MTSDTRLSRPDEVRRRVRWDPGSVRPGFGPQDGGRVPRSVLATADAQDLRDLPSPVNGLEWLRLGARQGHKDSEYELLWFMFRVLAQKSGPARRSLVAPVPKICKSMFSLTTGSMDGDFGLAEVQRGVRTKLRTSESELGPWGGEPGAGGGLGKGARRQGG